MTDHTRLNRWLVVCLCAATVLAASSPAFLAVDGRLMDWVHANQNASFVRLALVVTRLGSTPFGLAVVVLAAIGFLATRRSSDALFLTLAVGLELRLIGPLKLFFDRPRPIFADQTLAFVGSGFPSGHAMTVTAVSTALSLIYLGRERRPARRRIVMCAAAALIAVVAGTRVYLGAHFLTDVVGGVAFGLLSVVICRALVDWLEPYLRNA